MNARDDPVVVLDAVCVYPSAHKTRTNDNPGTKITETRARKATRRTSRARDVKPELRRNRWRNNATQQTTSPGSKSTPRLSQGKQSESKLLLDEGEVKGQKIRTIVQRRQVEQRKTRRNTKREKGEKEKQGQKRQQEEVIALNFVQNAYKCRPDNETVTSLVDDVPLSLHFLQQNCSANCMSSARQTYRGVWTAELQEIFVNVVTLLGGAVKATPMMIKKAMDEHVLGLTRNAVSRHLQMYRNTTLSCCKRHM